MSSLSSSYQSLFNETTGVFSNAAIKDLSNTLIACDVNGNVIAATAIAPLTYTAGTAQLSLGYNASNLKITSSLLNTIQDITTASTPEFAALKLTTGAGAGKYLQSDASGNTSWQTIPLSPAPLTKIDDVNISLTLGGLPNTALLQATSITAGWLGQLSLARGGTNVNNSAAANGGVAYKSASGIEITANALTGRILQANGTSAPTWSSATYPSTAGTTSTILRSDGTNWVNSSNMTVDSAGYVTSTGLTIGTTSSTVPCISLVGNVSGTTFRALWLNNPSVTTNAGIAIRVGVSNNPDISFDGLSWVRTSNSYNPTLTISSFNANITLGGNNADNCMGMNDSAPRCGFSCPTNAQIGFASSTTAPANSLVVSGNIGIGTSNPSQKLEITGSNAQIFLNSGTSNMLMFNTAGVAPPTFTTARSVGTKIVLYPQFVNGSAADYAIGIDASTMWFGVPTAGAQFRWYGGITAYMRLNSTGLTIGSPTTTSMFNVGTAAQFQVNSSGSVVAGTWNGTNIDVNRGGTGADLSGTGGTSQVLRQSTVGGTITVSQLAASDLSNGVTGGGAVVLATSPTLITPLLGTPGSGVLTNCTGYPTSSLSGTISLTSQVAGVLPATNGGTGQSIYTVGDILFANTTTTLSKLAVGSVGTVLTVAAGVPSWQALSGIGVTSITGTANQITSSGTTGAITLSLPTLFTPPGIIRATGSYTLSSGSDETYNSLAPVITSSFTTPAITNTYMNHIGGSYNLALASSQRTNLYTTFIGTPTLSSPSTSLVTNWTSLYVSASPTSSGGINVTNNYCAVLMGRTGINQSAPQRMLHINHNTPQIRLSTGSPSYTDIFSNSSSDLIISSNGSSGQPALSIMGNSNIVPGIGAISTTAITGFMYLPTCAGRPTGTPTSYTGRAAVVIDTTNNQLCYYNPSTSAWMTPGWAVLYKSVVGPSVLTVSIQNIPATYSNLRLCVRGAVSGGVRDNLVARFNNDSGANYTYQELYGEGGTAAAGGASGFTYAILSLFHYTIANTISYSETTISDYTHASFDTYHGCLTSYGCGHISTTNRTGFRFNQWAGTAAINRIDLFFGSGYQFGEGTVITLYGYM